MRVTRNRSLLVVIFALLFITTADVQAEDEVTSMRLEYWSFGADGEAAAHGASVDIDEKALDGKGNGLLFGMEKRFEGWGLNLDLFAGRRSGSHQISSSQSVDSEFEFSVLSFAGFLTLIQPELDDIEKEFAVDGYAGLRPFMNMYKLTYDPDDPTYGDTQSDYVSWVDPYFGLRMRGRLNPKWAAELYGDFGGFGIGNASELSVIARGTVVWTMKPGFNILAGYRFFGLESEHQSGDRQTAIDLNLGGPTLGAEFTF